MKVITKRNDLRLHNHQHLQLQGWRANCDIQVVIDYRACVEYLKKYTSKGEPCSSVLKTAFNSFVQQTHKTYKESDNEVTWSKGLFCTRDYVPLVVIETVTIGIV